MKFTPFSPELRKHSFIVASESVRKCTPSQLAKIMQECITYLSTYKFDACAVKFDGATKIFKLSKGLAKQYVSSFIAKSLRDEFQRINFD